MISQHCGEMSSGTYFKQYPGNGGHSTSSNVSVLSFPSITESTPEIIDQESESYFDMEQQTSVTDTNVDSFPRPIPIITEEGARQFYDDLENFEYAEEEKAFYKDCEKLVDRLNIIE